MSDGLDKDQDPIENNWLTNWEDQCVDEWENDIQPKLEDRIALENEKAAQKMWLSFQNSASSISLLYKEGCHQNCVSMWVPFQNAASSVTTMQRDGMDLMKKCFELGKQYGQHRRNDEVLSWTKKHRRHIRREELIGYLCGKAPPARHKPNGSLGRSSSRVNVDRASPRLQSPRVPSATEVSERTDDLQPFRDALALQGLNGAMSSFGIRTGGGAEGGSSPAKQEDIHGFILEEMSRRCMSDAARKRNAPADNAKGMDSPTRKRSRLL